ncbi:MAG: sigma-54-dependent Fis family transcriptional regulator [Myxococcales bacterium]|nr:sigma-54-dependent Fis family transcriptional regulator [Myxococcales bacterium]
MPPRARSDVAAKPSVLLAVGPLLQREVDLDELLAAIVHKIAQALSADRGTIYLVDPEAGELFSKAAHLPELKEIRLRIGQGIAGTVAATGQTVNLPTADADRRFFRAIDRQTGYRTRSMLATPLRDRSGAVIGVVQVLNAARGAFSAADEEYLKRLSAEAALAIESTSLYAQVRPRERRDSPPGAPPLPLRYRYNRIVGESPAMQRVYDLVRKAAATSATVLLRGESGTGKELIARAVHYNGARREGPFVKVDCTTIPATLMENELFGHERGAYTGAQARSVGKCELAAGGTLFIDELGELPVGLQAKLLRFLQDREFERVGGTRTLTADARVVTATHRDLEAMVGRGQFREDLYYRVKVVQIPLPTLAERGPDDVTRLAAHFLDQYAKKHGKPVLAFTRGALDRLLGHRWPGNIRELENCVESAVVLCDGEEIAPEHLALPPAAVQVPSTVAGVAGGWRPQTLREAEREHVLRTIEAAEGNRSRAAELLGIGRNTLLRKLKEYGEA